MPVIKARDARQQWGEDYKGKFHKMLKAADGRGPWGSEEDRLRYVRNLALYLFQNTLVASKRDGLLFADLAIPEFYGMDGGAINIVNLLQQVLPNIGTSTKSLEMFRDILPASIRGRPESELLNLAGEMSGFIKKYESRLAGEQVDIESILAALKRSKNIRWGSPAKLPVKSSSKSTAVKQSREVAHRGMFRATVNMIFFKLSMALGLMALFHQTFQNIVFDNETGHLIADDITLRVLEACREIATEVHQTFLRENVNTRLRELDNLFLNKDPLEYFNVVKRIFDGSRRGSDKFNVCKVLQDIVIDIHRDSGVPMNREGQRFARIGRSNRASSSSR